jgi:hypothetical protein
LDICKNLNIRTTGYFIMGSPIETQQDLAKTYWFIRHNIHELHTAGMFCLIPFPGTRFWSDYQEYTGKTPDYLGWEVFDHKFMDWDEGYPFFINQHYTPAFLQEAYREFAKLRPRLASDPHWEREEERVMGYKRALYNYLRPIIGEKTQLLEVTAYANSYYEWSIYYEMPVQLYPLNNPERDLPKTPVEALYLNHCLEVQPDPLAFLQQILNQVKVNGPIYLSFYNALFLPVIERLLSGQTPDIFEPPYWQSQRKLFSFPQMLKLLKQAGLEMTDVYRNPQPLDSSSEFSRLVPPLLEQLAHPELAREMNIYSYFLVLQKT